MKMSPGKEAQLWQTHVVMSTVPRDQLPQSLSQDGAKRLCEVESVLENKGVEMKVKNRHWYNRGNEYVRAKFNIKVILGAADIKFQLQTKDEKVFSNTHDTIEVRWEASKRTSAHDGDGMAIMYRER